MRRDIRDPDPVRSLREYTPERWRCSADPGVWCGVRRPGGKVEDPRHVTCPTCDARRTALDRRARHAAWLDYCASWVDQGLTADEILP